MDLRILDQDGNELAEFDPAKGHLIIDRILAQHHDAVEAVEAQGHYETIAEYPKTGGKEVKWVVDVPAVEAKDAYDEYEDIYRYVPYTETELAQRRIDELKQKLLETDYAVIKIAEGAATVDEYAEVITNRSKWREEINELEKVLSEE